jgi:hypothetical protein
MMENDSIRGRLASVSGYFHVPPRRDDSTFEVTSKNNPMHVTAKQRGPRRDFRFRPLHKQELRSSGLLCSV